MTQITTGITKTRTQYNDPMRNKVRLKIIGTKRYLHLSGRGETTGTTYAWIGTREQADKLRELAKIQGGNWLFSRVRAKMHTPSVVDEVAV